MKENSLAKSYLQLRNMIGVLGISLPIICFFGGRVWGCSFTQPSLSHYYYSSMHFAFVGTLAVLGFFLVLYKSNGHNPKINRLENWLSSIAGIAGILVAMFPTNINSFCDGGTMECVFITAPTFEKEAWVETVHFSAAGTLFLCFVLLCLFVFPHKDDVHTDPVKKKRRNVIYRSSGILIIVTLLGLLVFSKVAGVSATVKYRLVYWAEFVCLIAFGNAWLVKGSQLWADSDNKILKGMVQMIR